MLRQLAKVGTLLMSVMCSTKPFWSSGLNRPERSRSARTTPAILGPACGSPPPPGRKSGMAMGSGWALPCVTSTWSAARAGVAAPKAVKAASRTKIFFKYVIAGSSALKRKEETWLQHGSRPIVPSLTHHLAGIEPQRIDVAPLGVAVGRQPIGLALINRAAGRFGGGASIGVSGSGCGRAHGHLQPSRRAVGIERQIIIHDQILGVGRAGRRRPAAIDLAPQGVRQIGGHHVARADALDDARTGFGGLHRLVRRGQLVQQGVEIGGLLLLGLPGRLWRLFRGLGLFLGDIEL